MIIDMNHLKKIDTGYWNHFRYAFYFSVLSLCAGLIGLIHTFIPFLFPFLPIQIIDHIKMEFDNEVNVADKE